MTTNTIGIIGIGKLGLSFALLAEKSGYKVIGYDTRRDYIESLLYRTYKTSEPHINEYLETSQISYAQDLGGLVYPSDVLFCFVATPSLPDGSYDHSAIDSVVNNLQELHVQGVDMTDKILVIGCTTMPGYCDTIANRLESTGISVAYNPEFIAQGDIINGLRTADMVLIGVQEESTSYALAGIYRTIMTKIPIIKRMSRKAAELTKISINCYLTMKIAYANMIGDTAISSGLESEVSTILQAIGSDTRISNKYLKYGFSPGGPCIPRDMRALRAHAITVEQWLPIAESVDEFNEFHSRTLFYRLRNTYKDRSIPFLFTQLTYKSGVDILTESQQLQLCTDLLDNGYMVDITESDRVVEQVKLLLEKYGDRVTYGTATQGIKIEL